MFPFTKKVSWVPSIFEPEQYKLTGWVFFSGFFLGSSWITGTFDVIPVLNVLFLVCGDGLYQTMRTFVGGLLFLFSIFSFKSFSGVQSLMAYS